MNGHDVVDSEADSEDALGETADGANEVRDEIHVESARLIVIVQ